MHTRLMPLMGLALFLAGCASSGPQPPAHIDAFTGLYNRSADGIPSDRPVRVEAPAAIILSDNFENWFKYVEDSNAYWGKIVPASLTNTVVMADTHPLFISARVLETLKRRFPTAEVVNDFPQAVATGKKAVLLVDLRAKPLEPYGDRTTRIGFDVFFFDAAMNPVSRMSGDGALYRPIGALDAGIQSATDTALAQLETKFQALVR